MGRQSGLRVIPELEQKFPNITGTPYERTSPATNRYNCVAYAVHENHRNWWPNSHMFWPVRPAKATLNDFKVMLIVMFDFEETETSLYEPGYERVAIFANARGIPTHAARQLEKGSWTSKLGQWIDISHTLDGMNGGEYGTVAFVMRRRVAPVAQSKPPEKAAEAPKGQGELVP